MTACARLCHLSAGLETMTLLEMWKAEPGVGGRAKLSTVKAPWSRTELREEDLEPVEFPNILRCPP